MADEAYPYKVIGTARDGSEIRKFTADKIASAIDSALAASDLKVNQNAAVVVTYSDAAAGGPGVIRGAVMVRKEVGTFFKRKVEFTFAGVLSHDFSTGDNRKEAGLVIRI